MLEDRKQALRERLKDPDEGVRQAAASALDALESALDLTEILDLLKRGSRGQRVKALLALERINSVEVFPPLLAALSFPDEDIRSTAVQVLGRKKIPRSWAIWCNVWGILIRRCGSTPPKPSAASPTHALFLI